MNQQALFTRLIQYQKERFPLVQNGLLIVVFTCSAIAYSRLCRGDISMVNWKDLMIGIFTNLTFFFVLRISDEFKDHKEDLLYRSYLPVPRGLVTLNELAIVGATLVVIQVSLILFVQIQMLLLFIGVWVYLYLMRYEFFVKAWLKEKQVLYVISHMAIIPIIDLYSSGLDWKLSNSTLHLGILWFVALSFCNGIVLEVGRKIKAPEDEEIGVITYSKLFGTKGGVLLWIFLLTVTFLLTLGAIHHAGFSLLAYSMITIAYLCSLIPPILFINEMNANSAKRIEAAAGIWTIVMYLTLGIVPLLLQL